VSKPGLRLVDLKKGVQQALINSGEIWTISLQFWEKRSMMFTACLPQHSQNPTRSNISSGLIRNSYLLNKQMIIDNSWLGLANTQDERFSPFLVSRSKGMNVDIWIRAYNPPRCFQKKISGRSKHNVEILMDMPHQGCSNIIAIFLLVTMATTNLVRKYHKKSISLGTCIENIPLGCL
jgi:hypothetical protein